MASERTRERTRWRWPFYPRFCTLTLVLVRTSAITLPLAPVLALFSLATLGLFILLGGAVGVAYLIFFLLCGAPGLPLGFALFGRRHLGGWITGLALGYALTTLSVWAVVYVRLATTPILIAAWLLTIAAAWLATRRVVEPLIAAPVWTRRDSAALCLVLLIVPLLLARPFSKIGSYDAEGNRLYRAYFVADFVWHTALTSELAKHEPHPRNPFMGQEPVHYYWTYFRIPATAAAQGGQDVQAILKLNATATAFVFLSVIYLAAWAAVPGWPFATALAVALTFLCPSAEGLAAIADLIRRGHSLAELRDLNIDAVASWAFKGVRVDNLPRAMWYNPQHSFSCALGLLSVPVAIWGRLRMRAQAIVIAGGALGASVAFNPLIGASFCAVYGLTILIETLQMRGSAQLVLRHGLAVIPVGLALAWSTFNEVQDGAGSYLVFGLWGAARNATLLNIALQLGPILIPIVIGLWMRSTVPFHSIWPAAIGVGVGLGLMHLVALSVNPAWVPFRGGQVFLVLAAPIVTRALVSLWETGRRSSATAVVAVVVLSGLPTSLIDEYNTQDVTNFNLSPGAEFHWTLKLTPDEQAAFSWIKAHTAADAIVQAEPIIRAREYWSYTATFGERRMATGNALSLVNELVYEEHNRRVEALFATGDAMLAWREAKALGINYLFVGPIDRETYPGATKFDENPSLFEPVFRRGEVGVYALRP